MPMALDLTLQNFYYVCKEAEETYLVAFSKLQLLEIMSELGVMLPDTQSERARLRKKIENMDQADWSDNDQKTIGEEPCEVLAVGIVQDNQ